MNQISTYIRPKAQMESDWDKVPDGHPKHLRAIGNSPRRRSTQLAGVGAQHDSRLSTIT